MDDTEFQKRISDEADARRRAGEVLGVDEAATPDELRQAWRRACFTTHPDQNPGDPDAQRRFRLVNCAYRLLVEGTPCEELLGESSGPGEKPVDGKHDLDNDWAFFLWWRDRFF